jgi:dolichyl-phosphate-mannose--protein O-mannosyl transferase
LINWLKSHWKEITVIAVVMLLAAAVRFYKLGAIPRVLDGDEGRIGLLAQLTTSGALSNPFALWENFGILYLQLINLSLRVFGLNAFALRLLPAIGGVLAVPAIYLLAQVLGLGLPSSQCFYWLFHIPYSFSRIVSAIYQGTRPLSYICYLVALRSVNHGELP